MVDVSAVKRRSGGAWVNVSNIYKRSGGAWVKVWPTIAPIVISASPSGIYYSTSGSIGSKIVSSGFSPAITVSGGTGTYTYAWTKLSDYDSSAGGSSGPTSINNASILNPSFTSTLSSPSGNVGARTSVWRLTVTSGSETATKDYNVYLEYTRT